MTFSVGMRAPSVAELIIDLAEDIAEPLGEESRYVDPDLAPAREPGEIDAASMRRVARSLSALRDLDDDALRTWFGRFITRYRSAHEAVGRARPISPRQLEARLARSRVVRNPWSRAAWSRAGRRADLFVGGDRHVCSVPAARLLAGPRVTDGGEFARSASAADIKVLANLINAGHFVLTSRR
jgi:50S ribosomal protein L16 3-hydroxylase